MSEFLSGVSSATTHAAATDAAAADESSGDVKNSDNSVSRWASAIKYFRASCGVLREGSTGEKCVVNAVIDVSGSMEGSKLIAVKLGICSLVANLQDTDELNITSFSGKCRRVTAGFVPVAELRDSAPHLLHGMQTEGSTACYDAVISGIAHLREHSRAAEPTSEKRKNIVIVLTDGADNESRHRPVHVLQHIVNPGIRNFMFLMVAADMRRREERAFEEWMQLTHCKQVSVSVRTGTRLVGVFKETLLSRVLQSEADSARFLQTPGEGVTADLAGSGAPEDPAFAALRLQLARPARPATNPSDECEDDEEEDDCSCGSSGVSRQYSVSDGGGDQADMWSDYDSDSDGGSGDECDDIVIGAPAAQRSMSVGSDGSIHSFHAFH